MSTCSHQPKDSCKSTSDCAWIISKGCRVRDNVPLATLAQNKKNEIAASKAPVKAKVPKKAPVKAKVPKKVPKKSKAPKKAPVKAKVPKKVPKKSKAPIKKTPVSV